MAAVAHELHGRPWRAQWRPLASRSTRPHTHQIRGRERRIRPQEPELRPCLAGDHPWRRPSAGRSREAAWHRELDEEPEQGGCELTRPTGLGKDFARRRDTGLELAPGLLSRLATEEVESRVIAVYVFGRAGLHAEPVGPSEMQPPHRIRSTEQRPPKMVPPPPPSSAVELCSAAMASARENKQADRPCHGRRVLHLLAACPSSQREGVEWWRACWRTSAARAGQREDGAVAEPPVRVCCPGRGASRCAGRPPPKRPPVRPPARRRFPGATRRGRVTAAGGAAGGDASRAGARQAEEMDRGPDFWPSPK